ncbi:DNA-directed RNA polymerase subunit E'' [Candidatus Pacearchaeota archaeon]|nr:DNA-directed RNA polymerase subunit E'' [Candidatus Pacearchaeota archaeon]
MATKEKSCLNCRTIYFGDKCSNCGETPSSNTFKGRIHVFDAEKSEMAENMKINSEGEFAIKSK